MLSNDPRGWAFLDESGSLVGESGVIVTPAADVAPPLAATSLLFAKLGRPELYTLGRRGRPEIKLALIPASGLTRRLPVSYPGATGDNVISAGRNKRCVQWPAMQRPRGHLRRFRLSFQHIKNLTTLRFFERVKAVVNGVQWEMTVVDDDSRMEPPMSLLRSLRQTIGYAV